MEEVARSNNVDGHCSKRKARDIHFVAQAVSFPLYVLRCLLKLRVEGVGGGALVCSREEEGTRRGKRTSVGLDTVRRTLPGC